MQHDARAAAFDHYASLVRRMDAEPALRIDLAHNMAIARAWEAWRDLFLSSCEEGQ